MFNKIAKLSFILFYNVILLLFPCVFVYAQNSVPFSISCYSGVSPNTNYELIQSPEIQKRFLPISPEKLNFGYTDKAVWLKVIVPAVKNAKPEYIFWVNFTTIDTVDFYQVHSSFKNNSQNNSQTYSLTKSGDMLPFVNREIKHRKFAFPIFLSDSTDNLFYVRVLSKSSLQIPINILERKDFESITWKHEIGLGIFYGAMLIMFFYNLFIFIALRDKNYLFYIFSILTSVATFGSLAGHQTQYLFPNSPAMANLFMPLSAAAFMTTAAMFAISFLEMKKYTPKFYYIYLGFIAIGVLLMLLFIIKPIIYGILGRIVITIGTFTALCNLIVGVVSLRSGNKAAKYYLLAFSFYMIGIIFIGLRSFGIVPLNFITLNGGEIGGMLEIMLLSFALSDKYNIYRREKEKAQRELLVMQQEQNSVLEQKVEQRTIALNETNETLQQTNEELFATVELAKKQSNELRLKNTEIMASINYARRIQTAILPSNYVLQTYMPPHFVYYVPKDVVSGDFYWFANIVASDHKTPNSNPTQNHTNNTNDFIFFAVADCTGHGVPGAFMTVMSNDILNQIVNDRHCYEPAQILSELEKTLNKTLQFTGNQEDDKNNYDENNMANNDNIINENARVNDGLDIALIRIDKANNEVIFSGANRSMLYFSVQENGNFTEIPENKFPIGSSFYLKKKIKQHTINYQKNDLLYLYTDGYADQFGGEKQKKFMVKKLKQLINEIHVLPMKEQKSILQQTMNAWKTNTEQTDDILVVGIKLE
jgi:serine phosphatase RsbU (regulator of sigma subunit)